MLVLMWGQSGMSNERPVTTSIDEAKAETEYLETGETLVVSQSGSISASPGIIAISDFKTIYQSGSITTGEANGYGIISAGTRNLITNTGSISTAGTGGIGIVTVGRQNEIINSGAISTVGIGGLGIFSAGSQNTITNAGLVNTIGHGGFGTFAVGTNNTINNTGEIYTKGAGGFGIMASGLENTITNSGLVSVQGASAFGIIANGSMQLISNKGLIYTNGIAGFGIFAAGENNIIINPGSISTSSDAGLGVFANGSNNTIINSGIVSTAGMSGFGLLVNGSRNDISNIGTIQTTGDIGFGIIAVEPQNKITNSGLISTTGTLGVGIHADKGSNWIKNAGSIFTTGDIGIGVLTNDPNNTIINSGSIETTGELGIGIYVGANQNKITNLGLIRTSGKHSVGINVSGDDNIVINAGSVISKKSYAIIFDGKDNTLNVQNNLIEGGIDLGDGGMVNINTNKGKSNLLTFEGKVNRIIGYGPNPLFTNMSTRQAATYDPTILASKTDALADMTSILSSIIPRKLQDNDRNLPVWIKGFGLASSYNATSNTLQRYYNITGIAMGYNLKNSKNLLFGLLGGYGRTSLNADDDTSQSFKTNSHDGFLGIYGQKSINNLMLDFSFYGGGQSFSHRRFVNDNLAKNGHSSSKASYEGWWLSTEAGVTYLTSEVNGWSIQPTVRLRYAHQWLGSYAELGGDSANANVDAQRVGVGQGFVGIGIRNSTPTQANKASKINFEGQVGYLYRGAAGQDTVNVTLIDQSLSIPTATSTRNSLVMSAAVTIDLTSAVELKMKGDFGVGTGMQYAAGGWAGLSIRF